MMKKLLFGLLLVFAVQCLKAQDSLKYSRKQITDDMGILLRNAEEIHPNLYHDISKQVLVLKTDSLIKSLPDTLSGLMAYHAFLLETAFINEGHTSVNTPQPLRKEFRSGRLKYIPLQVIDYNNKQFEANIIAKSGNVNGIKITAINNKSAESIFNEMMQLKGGLSSFRKVVTVKSFPLFLPVIGISAPYTVEYTSPDNTRHSVTLDGLSSPEYAALVPNTQNTQPYTFTILNGGYGYFNFRSMSNADKFVKFADSVFNVIDEQKIGKLVVDLRENSGGDSGLGNYLLGYVTTTPYRMAGGSEMKVSQQFKNQMNEPDLKSRYNKPAKYFTMANGEILRMTENDMRKPDSRKHQFKGKVCFLIGSFTFSSANMLASTIIDYKLATLIGEPVGEPANDYGELGNIDLPNTGFSGFTSTTLWIRPNGNTKDSKPVAPDYLVKAGSGAGDKVLEYSLEWLDGKK